MRARELAGVIRHILAGCIDAVQNVGMSAQYMGTPWLHSMREDNMFSSHTPEFAGLLALGASGRQDIVAAFSQSSMRPSLLDSLAILTLS